jgi:hypothetical protein
MPCVVDDRSEQNGHQRGLDREHRPGEEDPAQRPQAERPLRPEEPRVPGLGVDRVDLVVAQAPEPHARG